MESTAACSWNNLDIVRKYRTGVSLHGHTNKSHENLAFLGPLLESWLPGRYILRIIERGNERRAGVKLDLSDAFWISPIWPTKGFSLECKQIGKLGFSSFVSITDHDEIEACLVLRRKFPTRDIPISFEWSVTYADGVVFHVGVHNLPPEKAVDIHQRLIADGKFLTKGKLRELLRELASYDDVLVVLNHPLANEGNITKAMQEGEARKFLAFCDPFINALEINGMQGPDANKRVLEIAQELGYPVISGGDRHGFEPNCILNLTNATTFSDFVHEVRSGKSCILFMPQYRKHIGWRYAANTLCMLKTYRRHPKRWRKWPHRVHYRCEDGQTRTLGELCQRGHAAIWWLDRFVWLVSTLRLLCRGYMPGADKNKLLAMEEAFKTGMPTDALSDQPSHDCVGVH